MLSLLLFSFIAFHNFFMLHSYLNCRYAVENIASVHSHVIVMYSSIPVVLEDRQI